MKNVLETQMTGLQTRTAPATSNQLTNIKYKDYTLLGLRDYQTEKLLMTEFQQNRNKPINFKLPKLYTLVSQNRKVPLDETLSSDTKIFVNFESYKWSELYFHFFRKISHPETNRYIFENVLYKLDTYKAYFCIATLNSSYGKTNSDSQAAVSRLQAQVELVTQLKNHDHGQHVFTFFIYELILIAMNQPHHTWCSQFVTASEAIQLLNYFNTKDLVKIDGQQLIYKPQNLNLALQDYIQRQGRILITSTCEEIFTTEVATQFHQLFYLIENFFEKKFFETCFQHKTIFQTPSSN
ncbi:MAG: hypothetical protein JNL11_17150 [Bdellovibrionaceae bacterium]|nr:hypothetical protein [Pseudobdellovibrionaceae bacterium]